MRTRKTFWWYLVIIFLVYGAFFVYTLRSSLTGSFIVEEKDTILFNELPSEIFLKRGQDFFLDIDYDVGYVFSDDTPLFDINETTGEISFIPTDIGEYNVVFLAFRDVSNYHIKLVRIIVEQ